MRAYVVFLSWSADDQVEYKVVQVEAGSRYLAGKIAALDVKTQARLRGIKLKPTVHNVLGPFAAYDPDLSVTVPFLLEDDRGRTLRGRVAVNDFAVNLHLKGFGNPCQLPGESPVATLEYHRGEPRLVIWPEMRSDEPVVVNLSRAAEDRRGMRKLRKKPKNGTDSCQSQGE